MASARQSATRRRAGTPPDDHEPRDGAGAPPSDGGAPGRRAPDDATLYPIGTLARTAGVSTRTVRYYEEIGLLRTARRYAGGRRVFSADALERLRFIARLKRLGFSLEEIRHLNEVFAMQQSTAAMLDVLDDQLAGHVDALDEQMRELSRLRRDLVAYRGRIRSRLRDLRGHRPEDAPVERAADEGADQESA